jgi:hypothetical protein
MNNNFPAGVCELHVQAIGTVLCRHHVNAPTNAKSSDQVKPLSESPSGEPASEAAFMSGATRFQTFIDQGRAFLNSNLVNFDQSYASNELILKWENDVRVRTLRNRRERIAFVSDSKLIS